MPPPLLERLALELVFVVSLLIMVVFRRHAVSEPEFELFAPSAKLRLDRTCIEPQWHRLDIDRFGFLLNIARRVRIDRTWHVRRRPFGYLRAAC